MAHKSFEASGWLANRHNSIFNLGTGSKANMSSILAVAIAVAAIAYLILQLVLHATQSKEEPCLLETRVPFLDSAIGILRHGASYLNVIR